MNRVYVEEVFAQAYRKSLIDLSKSCDFKSSPRGLTIKENLNVTLSFDPRNFLISNRAKSSNLDYINGELEWYFTGSDRVDFISNYSKFWNTICNKDGTCNSAYGYLIFIAKNKHGFTQYQWALRQLESDIHTRKSIMFFNREDFQYDNNKDFVCTNYVIFFIRDSKLYMNVHMRSNDVILGTLNDVAFFSVLYQQVLRHLRNSYSDIDFGLYSHCVDSYHVYENKYDLVDRMIEHDFENIPYELSYDIIDRDGKFLNIINI